jgi:glycosyltransferase involved in cell wall biosynthesis
MLINYLYRVKIFELYLYTLLKENNEYIIPDDVPRKIVDGDILDLIKAIKKNKIDILIYNSYNCHEINILNAIKEFKIIYYNHSCLFFWIYAHSFELFSMLYKAYKNSKYIISLIPFENDYLFQKWGINSILMNNFITYNYNETNPSNLSSKIILMIGRGEDKYKRFDLGIRSMKYIIKKIPECKMKLISNKDGLDNIVNITTNLQLQNNIEFEGYIRKPELYFANASLHIFPSICEAFPMVLAETKIFGIPNIVLGLDYLTTVKGGTIIIYDDEPYSIAKEAIKIINNKEYRIKLGKEARESIKNFNNIVTLNKWIKLLLSIFNGDNYYQSMRKQDIKIDKEVALNLIETQIKLLQKREFNYYNISLNDIENITFLDKFK